MLPSCVACIADSPRNRLPNHYSALRLLLICRSFLSRCDRLRSSSAERAWSRISWTERTESPQGPIASLHRMGNCRPPVRLLEAIRCLTPMPGDGLSGSDGEFLGELDAKVIPFQEQLSGS